MNALTGPAEEQVVLLDESGARVGTAAKRDVHHADTPLHLAFSCYVFDSDDRLLVTRRALHKTTWPGVWTNSACGHPAPEEDLLGAVRRRVGEELGIGLDDLRLVLPTFRYRAVMPDGTVENEMCPVLVARTRDAVAPDPAEVDDTVWTPWADFRDSVLDGSREVSPWCREQVAALPEEPWTAPAADPASLPAALH
ncbi:MAG: isopentenyl-diphosphate Delta-isomerase [Nocardioides sp.]